MLFFLFYILFFSENAFSQRESVIDPHSKRLSCILQNVEPGLINEILTEEKKIIQTHEEVANQVRLDPEWIEKNQIDFDHKMLEINLSTKKIWTALGIEFKEDSSSLFGLEVVAGEKTALNRFAASASRKNGKVVFVPGALFSNKVRQAKIVKNEGSFVIFVPIESAWKGSPANVSMIHEWIHALYFSVKKFSDRKMMSNIIATSKEGALPFSDQMSYGARMSFEEWHTHLSDLSLHQKRITNSPDSILDFERWTVKVKRLHWMRKRILSLLNQVPQSVVTEAEGKTLFQIHHETSESIFEIRMLGDQKTSAKKLHEIKINLEKIDRELDLVYHAYQEEIAQGFLSNQQRQKFVERITQIYLDLYPI